MKKNTKILIGLLILVLIGGGVFYGVSDMGAGQIKKLNSDQKKSPDFKEMKEPKLGSVIANETNKVMKKKEPYFEPNILEAVSGLDAKKAKKLDFKGPNIVPKKEKKSDILVPKIFNFDADVAKKLADAQAAADAKAAADAQAAADSKAAAAKKIADVQKLAKYEAEAKAAYEKKIADAQAAEAKKLADAKYEAEGKKLADAKVAADAQAAEAKKLAKAEYEKKLAEAIAEYEAKAEYEAIAEDTAEKLDPSYVMREERYYDPKASEAEEDWYKEYIYYIARMEKDEGKVFSTLEKMILKAMWSEAWTSERAASEELPY